MLKNLILICTASFLVACSQKAPDCAAPETQELLLSSIHEKIQSSGVSERLLNNLANQGYLGVDVAVKGKISDLKFALDKTAPTKYEKEIDKHFCKADLVSSYGADKSVVTVEYTSQKADGGKKHFVEMKKLTTENIGELMAPLLKDVSKEQSAMVAQMRSQIGDENIDNYAEKKCNGLDQDAKQCAIAESIKQKIKQEEKEGDDKLTQSFLDDRKKLVETYNNCVASYNKNGARKGGFDGMKKANRKLYLECGSAYNAAARLGVKDIDYFFTNEIGK
jgi:hypothetical protein